MYRKFPDWEQNPYLSQLPAKHKLVLKLLKKRRYLLIKLLFMVGGSK